MATIGKGYCPMVRYSLEGKTFVTRLKKFKFNSMPFVTDNISICCPFLDRRTKLLPCQKEMVLHYHKLGYSQRKIASMFNVSRRLVIFITHPEKMEKNKQDRRDRGGSKIYYDKDKHTKAIREHRRFKYKVLKESIKND